MKARSVLAFAALLLTSGCATIVQGSHQRVSVSSIPPGARVVTGGETHEGVTPTTVRLSRRGGQTVWVEAPGEQRYAVTFTRRHSVFGWWMALAGNSWNLGLGFFVDWATGAIYELTPDFVMAPLGGAPIAAHAIPAPATGAQPTPTPAGTMVPAPPQAARAVADAPGMGAPAEPQASRFHLTPWLAERYGREFYWWECPAARQLSRQFEVAFATYEEAHASGRRVSPIPECQGPERPR